MTGACSERNGVEPASDWVSANAIICVSGTNVWTAAGFLAEEMNAKKEAIACTNEWTDE